ncbi:MAG: hypothetical protein RIS85_305 [Pseudomonadota bacterium]
MHRILTIALVALAAPAVAAEEAEKAFDPASVSVVDAINCHLDAPTYNGFALSVAGDDGIARQRGWLKVETGNPFLLEYDLPEPITITGAYATRRIAFSSSGVMAVLDLADPAVIARDEGIANAADPTALIDALVAEGKATRAQIEADMPFAKFLGERVLVDLTEPASEDDNFGTHTVIARSISNVTTHPGKTLYGCSYRIEMLDKDGKPL